MTTLHRSYELRPKIEKKNIFQVAYHDDVEKKMNQPVTLIVLGKIQVLLKISLPVFLDLFVIC